MMPHPDSAVFFHLASAAFLAISVRRFLLSLAARIFPPLSPPSLPRATAAGFFSLGFWPVASRTTESASSFGSFGRGFLERLGMRQ